MNDDKQWWSLLREFYQRFKYQTIMTEVLELKFDEAAGTVSYRWRADEASFAMPVRVGKKNQWQIIQPTKEWKSMATPLRRDEFEVAGDLYYVGVSKS